MNNKNMNEFLQIAEQNGRIKDIREAFFDYPVEEEWHKGKIENLVFLKEESQEYTLYNIGDIVFVNEYKYENGSVGNNHLFVIIEQNNIAVPIESFGMLISSNLKKLKYATNKLIKKDEQNGLNKDSLVKTDVIYKISNNQILFKIGEVGLDKVDEYKKAFYETLE